MTMNILITGATGFIGSHITSALLKTGHQITVCVRNPKNALIRWQGIKAVGGDFSGDMDVDIWTKRLSDIDIVINTVGIIRETTTQKFAAIHNKTPCALFKACSQAGVRKVIQISALGADETALSEYHLSKKNADECLMSQNLEWTIIMPSIVYGPGAKSMAFFKAISALPFIPIVDKGCQQVQPVHIDDLVRVVMDIITTDRHDHSRIEIVGPEPITIKLLYSQLRHWLGVGQPRFISIPYFLALQLAKFGGFLGSTPISKEAVQMLQKGNTADVTAFVKRFNFMPRSISQSLADLPAQQSDRWHGQLFFLRPLLRIAIAFLWIATGIISALIFPIEQSYAMLGKAGITGTWAPVILYGAAVTDLLLGLATLLSFRLRMVGKMQIAIILLYTILISFSQPEYWLHPFGPITKNIPLLMATMIMLTMENKNGL